MRSAALRLTVFLACSIMAPLVLHAEGLVLDQSPSATGAERVFLAKNGPGALVAVATGEVADIPEMTDLGTVAGGRLSWAVVSDEVDDINHRHVTYQQVYHAQGVSAIPAAPVSGGQLAFHYDGQGELRAVIGARFSNVESVRELALASVEEAQAMAWSAVDNAGEVETAILEFLDAAQVQSLRDRTNLSLASDGSGRRLGYVWETPVVLASGRSHVAVVDALDGRLLDFYDPNPKALCAADCSPATSCTTQDGGAKVDPQNPSITQDRDSEATPSTYWGSPYTHEAHRQPVGDIPEITVYRGVDSGMCGSGGLGLWRILPLESANGHAFYGNQVARRSAGDAMTKMVRVMEALGSLGWTGINNSDLPVEVVIAGRCFNAQEEPEYDNAYFNYLGDLSGPTDSIVVCWRSSDPYEHSASLDVLAHEAGHGVLFASEGHIPYNTQGNNKEYHEGFADFIGYAVEWLQDPAESTQEQPDWTYREDVPPAQRDVEHDDTAHQTPELVEPRCYHLNETNQYCDPTNGDPYRQGNLIPVAYRLAVEGGPNPICYSGAYPTGDRPFGLDCGFEVDPLWLNHDANVIFATEVFFRVMTVYMSTSTDWDEIADYAKMAAHDLYRVNELHYCYDAVDEQQVVFDALKSVGIDGSPNWWSCVCEQNCHDEES